MAAVTVWPGANTSVLKSEPPDPPEAMATTMVSPMAREMPRIRAATMPDTAAGSTTRTVAVIFLLPMP